MFERFTSAARRVVVLAQEEARDRHAAAIRTEHLLLGIYGVPDSPATRLLAEKGVDRDEVIADIERLHTDPTVEPDAEALAAIGIDLDEVRRQADEAFGPGALDRTGAARRRQKTRMGHIPFDTASRKTLELALREALRLRHKYIGTEHVLLGMLHPGNGGGQAVLAQRGITLDQMRAAVAGPADDAASG
jgi:ATP-dependent Clp protease ATP-binding subunit ClpA